MKNHKIGLTALLIVFTLTESKAQYFSIGPSVGFQHSWITGTLPEGVSRSFNPGFNAGASFVYSTKSHFGIGADLKYSMEGAREKVDTLSENFNWNSSYLRIPIRAIYFFGDYGSSVRPKVFLGPTFGFLLSSKAEGIDLKDETNSFDAGFHVGAGVNIKLAEAIWLNTDITYTQGLIDVPEDNLSDESKLNGNLALNVGVLFGFK